MEIVPTATVASGVMGVMGTEGHEQVAYWSAPEVGLRAIIAIHSTRLGPALGGTRFYPFESEEAAVADVLRLAKAMSYKSAAAGLDLGGGKAVVIGDPKRDKTEALLRSYAKFVDSLSGRYYTTEDVGSTVADMEIIAEETPFVTGKAVEHGGSGDPSPATAIGVLAAMRAASERLWATTDLAGRHVVVLGAGKVGGALVHHLVDAGCRVTAGDVSDAALAALPASVEIVPPEKAHAVECDLFSPCALGAGLNPATIPELRCAAVVGSANNQLATPECGDLLDRARVLYIPDYVANAGGVINIAFEIGRPYSWTEAEAAVLRVFDNTRAVLDRAERERITTASAADRIAQERIAKGDHSGLPPREERAPHATHQRR
ncbi:MAG TPA: Glu/Leu/Phe/Val dehydrogenase dimerization domain-containing protein [Acidimicrobiia bacterium]|nr:Glu/Leu/Phe/Val dehydrogenase dimerization domain-containing protein [Acidimicrobiia bacterium]